MPSTVEQPSIVVIDPGTRVAELDSFHHIQSLCPIACTYHKPALLGMQSLESLSYLPIAVIILGSSASPLDKLDWQTNLSKWLQRMINKSIPMLALCYGHQLLAYLDGAPIKYITPTRSKEIGTRKLKGNCHKLFNHINDLELVISHCEEVGHCPPSYEVIASSPKINVEALAHREKPIWTLQAHPEATTEFLVNQEIRISDTQYAAALEAGSQIIRNFLVLVEDYSKPAPKMTTM